MAKTTEIREICGDYAFDVEYSKDNVFTMMFNSRRNAETVKRCIEVDDSIPNVATPVDFVEVVRCKDCSYRQTHICAITGAKTLFCDYWDKPYPVEENHYCGYGKSTPQKER